MSTIETGGTLDPKEGGHAQDVFAESSTGVSVDPFSNLPEETIAPLKAKKGKIEYKQNAKRGYWKIDITFDDSSRPTPERIILEHTSLIRIVDTLEIRVPSIHVTILGSKVSSIFDESLPEARKKLIEAYVKNLLDIKRGDNNRYPQNGDKEDLESYEVIEKYKIGQDPTNGTIFEGYRYWSNSGGLSPVIVKNGGRIVYCNWTHDLEVAKTESISSDPVIISIHSKEPEKLAVQQVLPIAVSTPSLAVSASSETKTPKEPSKKDKIAEANRIKLAEQAEKQTQVKAELNAFSKKIELTLEDWTDIPKIEGKAVCYTDASGNKIREGQKAFSHPNDPSITLTGHPYVIAEGDGYYLRYAATPSERQSRHTSKKLYEDIIRPIQNLRNEQLRAAAELHAREEGIVIARENFKSQSIPISDKHAASLSEPPILSESGSLTISTRVFNPIVLPINGISFRGLPYLDSENLGDGKSALVVKYALSEELPEIDSKSILAAIKDSKDRFAEEEHKRQTGEVLKLLESFHEEQNISLMHREHYPSLDRIGNLIYRTSGNKELTIAPNSFAHSENEDVTVLGYPYITLEDDAFYLKYAASLEEAKKNNISLEAFEHQVLLAAREELRKHFAHMQRIIPDNEILTLHYPKRKKDGSVRAGPQTFEIAVAKRRGFELPYVPSLRVINPESDSPSLMVYYTQINDAELPSGEEFRKLLQAVKDRDEHERALMNENLEAQTDSLSKSLSEISEPIDLSLSHRSNYPLMSDEGQFTVICEDGRRLTYAPKLLTHPDNPDAAIMVYPYVRHEKNSYSVRYASTRAEAQTSHLNRKDFTRILTKAATKEIFENDLNDTIHLSAEEITNMSFPVREADGSLTLSPTHVLSPKSFYRRGITITLVPSLKLHKVEGELPTVSIRYSLAHEASLLTSDQFSSLTDVIIAPDLAFLDIESKDDSRQHNKVHPTDPEKNVISRKNRKLDKTARPNEQDSEKTVFDLLIDEGTESYEMMMSLYTSALAHAALSDDAATNNAFWQIFNIKDPSSLISLIDQSVRKEENIPYLASTKARHIKDLATRKDEAWQNADKFMKAYAAEAFLEFASIHFGYNTELSKESIAEALNARTAKTDWLTGQFGLQFREVLRIMTHSLSKIIKAQG